MQNISILITEATGKKVSRVGARLADGGIEVRRGSRTTAAAVDWNDAPGRGVTRNVSCPPTDTSCIPSEVAAADLWRNVA